MTNHASLSQSEFRRILARNIALPLGSAIFNSALFALLVFYLLSAFKSVEHSEEVIGKSHEVMKLSIDKQTGLRGYLITLDETFLKPAVTAGPALTREMTNLKTLVSDNETQVARLQRVEALLSGWEKYAEQVITLRQNNQDYVEVVRQQGGEFDAIRDELIDFQIDERKLLGERSDTARTVTLSVILGYIVLTLISAAVLSAFGRRELVQLSNTYSKSISDLYEIKDELEQQAWQRTGQAQLSERCVGQTALPILGRAALDFLAQYIGVAVAVLYIRDREGSPLRPVAAYGFDLEIAKPEASSGSRESLVEQAVFSNRMIRLDEIPDHYLKVNSGLGNASPRSIVFLPTHHEGKLNGVLELGFLQPPQPHELEFLTLVAPNIGNTVELALHRHRLQAALEETQQLNEELNVQQEELRSSNEELEEQARVLEESQSLLENQKAELEQNNEKLAEQALLLDQRNLSLQTIQAELEERARDLQRASKYKSDFLANMSHELRTPLNSSMILAKLLADNQKENLDEEQVQFAQSIYSSGNDLLNLINDILDISKVEAGQLELVPEEVDLSQILNGLKMTFEPIAAQKQLQLDITAAANSPRSIVTDPLRLEQILKNLLSNAVKFTDAGEVQLTLTQGENGGVIFEVKDSGIGIALDQQKIIFEAFQQADGGINRRYGGTGLGLSISRDLAALLGGSITVKSQPGEGSTFSLLLPARIPTADTPPPRSAVTVQEQPETVAQVAAPAPQQQKSKGAFADDRNDYVAHARTVLVIEDDVPFARILYGLAHELRYQCLVALNATEGLQLAHDFIPDAVLLDIGLPDISGISVLQKLKISPETRHIPVHIISANERAEATLQLGALGYVVKPTTRERLLEVFQTVERKLTQKTKQVLVVEDDKTQREAIVHLIADEDVKITAVALGEEALALLRTTIFDCMIIDLKLPDMHGHELLQRMSMEEVSSFPPVIVYTGRNLTRDEEHELLRYSRSIIIKGARSPERLLDEVTLFLHKVESELSVERQNMLKVARGRDRVLDGRRILVVDDDARNVFALTGALEQKGAIVEIARNGYEAIDQLDQIADIDLVLMDIMMPGMDGLEAMRRIRSDARFTSLPIIAITAKAMKDDQEQCLAAGASDYMAKPIDLDRLYSLLRVWMPSLERLL